MKAAVLHGPRRLKVEEAPSPKIEPEEVLIKVKACGLCMTDLHMYEWDFPVKTPVILGHEFSGDVVETGKMTTSVSVGDRVAVNPLLSCGACTDCREGRNNLCKTAQAIGGAGNTIVDGALAEYVRTPQSNVLKLPENVSYDAGAFVEPLACCVHGVDLSKIRLGDRVAIVGAGTIGLLILQLVKFRGPSLTMVSEMNATRLHTAGTLGADVTVDPMREDLVQKIMDETEGRGADVVIEAVGSPKSIRDSMRIVKRGGRIVVFGVSPKNSALEVSPFEIYFRELEVVGAYALTPSAFYRSASLLASNAVEVVPLITEHLTLEQVEEGLHRMKNKAGLKKIVSP